MKSFKGFTLIELLIAISIFAVVIFITSSLFVDAVRMDRKTSLRQQVYMDSRYVLDQISKTVHDNAIDYNEYYNQIVLAGAYGANHGAYTALFYDPGLDENGAVALGSFGQYCNDKTKWKPGMDCTISENTVDKNTGQNPYNGIASDVKMYNAVCGHLGINNVGHCALDNTTNLFDELYLISPDGREKTIFVKESTKCDVTESDSYAISYVKMDGSDNDGDGIADKFTCAGEFECRDDLRADKNSADCYSGQDTKTNQFSKDFVPISSTRINIQELKFYIAPLEDPFYAFAESDASVQKLPHVTVIMKVAPNKNVVGASVEDFTLDLQETVSTTLLKKVPTPILGQY